MITSNAIFNQRRFKFFTAIRYFYTMLKNSLIPFGLNFDDVWVHEKLMVFSWHYLNTTWVVSVIIGHHLRYSFQKMETTF